MFLRILSKKQLYFFICICLLFAFNACTSKTNAPKVEKGILDLSQYDLEQYEKVKLNGEWEFYWEKLYQSSEIQENSVEPSAFIQVPSSWNGLLINGKPITRKGYASYRLVVKLPKKNLKLALKMPTVGSAYRLYINGDFLGQVGKVATTAESNQPDYHPQIIDFENPTTEAEIVIQVSNYLQNTSGLRQAIILGIADCIHQQQTWNLMLDFTIYGVLIMMLIYHLVLFFIHKRGLSALFFSFICFVMLMRSANTGQYHFKFLTGIDLITTVRLELLPICLAVLAITWFLHTLFPNEYPKLFMKLTTILGIVGSIMILLLPYQIFSSSLMAYQIYMLGGGAFSTFFLIKAILNKRDYAITIGIAYFIFFFTAINDILYSIELIDSIYLSNYGVLTLILLQSFVISSRFAQAFQKSEDLGVELQDLVENLEFRVKERTEKLQLAHEEVQMVNDTLKVTLDMVAHQRDEMLDSIQYAQRIQASILPRQAQLQSLLPDHFVLFKPRDVVSGDFYWLTKSNEKIILAAIDCTGHGVPGAFMSIVGNDLLNAIIKNKHILKVDEILSQLHKDVRQVLQQKETNTNDGMDMALVSIDLVARKLQFAGAKNPLIYIQNEKLHQINGDKIPIGGEQREIERIFTLHELDITEPTTFYIYSDDYQDQFGGKKGKKFMTKRFRELLFEIHSQPMEEQKMILEETLTTWMGTEEQVDDILVIGVKF